MIITIWLLPIELGAAFFVDPYVLAWTGARLICWAWTGRSWPT